MEYSKQKSLKSSIIYFGARLNIKIHFFFSEPSDTINKVLMDIDKKDRQKIHNPL